MASKDVVEGTSERLCKDAETRRARVLAEEQAPASGKCMYGGCSSAHTCPFQNHSKLKFVENEQGLSVWGKHSVNRVDIQPVESRTERDGMLLNLMYRNINKKFKLKQAIVAKYCPHMKPEDQALMGILEEPAVPDQSECTAAVEKYLANKQALADQRKESKRETYRQMADAMKDVREKQEARMADREAAVAAVIEEIRSFDSSLQESKQERKQQLRENLRDLNRKTQDYIQRIEAKTEDIHNAMLERLQEWGRMAEARANELAESEEKRKEALREFRRLERARMEAEANVEYQPSELGKEIREFETSERERFAAVKKARAEATRNSLRQSREAASEYYGRIKARMAELDEEIEQKQIALKEYAEQYRDEIRGKAEARKAELRKLAEIARENKKAMDERIAQKILLSEKIN